MTKRSESISMRVNIPLSVKQWAIRRLAKTGKLKKNKQYIYPVSDRLVLELFDTKYRLKITYYRKGYHYEANKKKNIKLAQKKRAPYTSPSY